MQLPPKLPLLLVGDSVLMPGSSKRIKVDTPRNMKLVKEHLLRSTSLRSTIIGVIPGTKDPTTENGTPENIHQTGTAAIVVQITGTNWPKPHYTMLAHGLCRFTVKQILRDTPYLTAQVLQIGKWPSEDDDVEDDDEAVSGLASQVRNEALQLVEALDMSVPVVARLRSLLRRLPDHTLPDVLGAIVKSTSDEKMKILDAVDMEERLRRTLPLILRQLESIKFVKGKGGGIQPRRPRKTGLSDDIQDIVIIRQGSRRAKDGPKSRTFKITPGNQFDQDDDDDEDGLHVLERKLKNADLPNDVLKVANRELKRLKKLPSTLPDHALTHNYLELLTELPWNNSTADRLDLQQAKIDLDEDHYSMDKLKKRVLEYLAVRQLQTHAAGSEQNIKGPILCFVGPPGVGKTSVGRSIARTLGRKFHRISVGGVCDQSDIRGHRRTYVGSMPGRIINGLKTVGVNNPVFLLDEVDKLGKGLQGDPGAALLEVLDPEQNHTFVDHYLNVPFDLSSVLFIATANTTSSIPAALLDRMEVIEVPGYTQEEKHTIAKRHLLPKQLSMHGLPLPDQKDAFAKILISDDAFQSIISQYTREAGVRDLDRKLAAVCRAIAVQVASNKDASKEMPTVDINSDSVKEILGPIQYDQENAQLLKRPGVAAGLAWTRTGGEILYVEASRMDSGKESGAGMGQITLTGQLGDVMKESAQLAVSWLRSNVELIGLKHKGPFSNSFVQLRSKGAVRPECHLKGGDKMRYKDFLETKKIGEGDEVITLGENRKSAPGRHILSNTDIHLHFPAGAVGKDGPSAGVTIVTALVSLFTGKLVYSDLAMTGEITLRGLVLPVGGVKEKVLAAHRAGMKRVLLPKRNERDVEADLPENVLKQIDIIYVSSLEDVLAHALSTESFTTDLDTLTDTRPKSKL